MSYESQKSDRLKIPVSVEDEDRLFEQVDVRLTGLEKARAAALQAHQDDLDKRDKNLTTKSTDQR
jgi:hypothetical protein